jgi:hypothetical protein
MFDRSQPLLDTSRTASRSLRWTRYAAIGDSLSEGLGDPLTGGATRGWANLLAAHLRVADPRVEFLNLAVRGHLARDAVRRQLEAALAFEPDLVSIFIGGNDVLLRRTFDADTFERELSQLVEPFDRRGATIVLSTLPDLTACSPLLPPLRGLLRQRFSLPTRSSRGSAATTARCSSTHGPTPGRGATPCGASIASIPARAATARSPKASLTCSVCRSRTAASRSRHPGRRHRAPPCPGGRVARPLCEPTHPLRRRVRGAASAG